MNFLARLIHRSDPAALCAAADAQLPAVLVAEATLREAVQLIDDVEVRGWRPLAATAPGAALIELRPELVEIVADMNVTVRRLREGLPLEEDTTTVAAECEGLAGRVQALCDLIDHQ